jgi:hypothetical protein
MFLNADFGRGNVQHGKCYASKSAVLSLFLSLHKQKKEMQRQTKERRECCTGKESKDKVSKEAAIYYLSCYAD